jgi:hypothetical protein
MSNRSPARLSRPVESEANPCGTSPVATSWRRPQRSLPVCSTHPPAAAQEPGERPPKSEGVDILNPRGCVPVGLIIDDSTCQVNLAHFCIPQFAEVFPDRYAQSWKTLPREIPDAFVRKFGERCHEQGVRGKYSVIPYLACVGWLDRDLPGWSKRELRASLDLVRTLMAPDWDFHPGERGGDTRAAMGGRSETRMETFDDGDPDVATDRRAPKGHQNRFQRAARRGIHPFDGKHYMVHPASDLQG